MTSRERIFALEHFGIKLGLENINHILDALNRPERTWTAIHVAGTNGKGSVTAMVERGLRAAGHKTGRYTSPHLNGIEERIAIDGRPISSTEFDSLAADVLSVVDHLRTSGTLREWPTFFEVTTAIAFEAFRRANVTVAVIEVGLGGRFDATNVLVPAVAVITSIALDHERHLGPTIPQIAFEKAGIIKASVPVVVGELAAAAHAVIADRAREMGAPLIATGPEHIKRARLQRGRATIVLQSPSHVYDEVTLGLNGAHQIGNAAIAARALEVCDERGIRTESADVLTALSEVDWPARLEWLRVGVERHVLIDAAHNPAGAHALADYLVSADVSPLPVVFAVMQDKDVESMVRALTPVASRFVATDAGTARSIGAPDLAQLISRAALTIQVTSCTDPQAAISIALQSESNAVVAGSIFLAGPVRARLIERGASTVAHP